MTFFDWAWMIPLLPLVAFVVITFFAPLYKDKRTTAIIAVVLMVLATFIAWGVLLQGARSGFGAAPAEAQVTGGEAGFRGFGGAFTRSFDWAPTGNSVFRMGDRIDAPVAAMLAMVTLAATCIHLFSAGYMAEDPRFARFFSFIALFTASMLGMVLSDNLLLFFICWELMGLCSYLLIGFWYYKPSAYMAARKAFITTRIGDVGMMLGLFYLYQRSGSLTFGSAPGQVFDPAFLSQVSQQTTAFGLSVAAAIALLIFMGTVGKSAQFPLHVWLPDAMEGPTPVSALIHAATMVAAGVFLVARTYPIFVAGSTDASSIHALTVVALIGAFTAIFAALIAVAQFDIKRILAYSTLSQLGFMVAALGMGGWVAGMFHLLTHAFFKALLFLGSGSIIHGMEATVGHDSRNSQDIRNMGNLRRFMPRTYWPYMIGYLALAGVPLFSGFFSKDEILADAFGVGFGGQAGVVSPLTGQIVYILLTIAAFLTAFYMTRQIVVVFFGNFRGHQPRPLAATAPSEKVAVVKTGHTDLGSAQEDDEHTAAIYSEHKTHDPHDSPWTMLLPLFVLAIFAFGAGYANWPGLFGIHGGWLSHFFAQEEGSFNVVTTAIATLLAFAGIFLGYVLYRPAFAYATDADPLERMMPGIFRILNNKFGVDEFYGATIGRLTDIFGIGLTVFDKMVDSVVNGVGQLSLLLAKLNFIIDDLFLNQGADTLAEATTYTGDGMRQTTTGKIQDYGALIFTGVLILAVIYLFAFK
ncbi:MAG: NADH-quinone oxidoreductase subunit L [Herpetosiphonaceae bacterium]|nr:NADH-quinone oxidoreductase subunit L [Herpetosiphonaceae bacterium]